MLIAQAAFLGASPDSSHCGSAPVGGPLWIPRLDLAGTRRSTKDERNLSAAVRYSPREYLVVNITH